jgi:hypothetical protein
MIITVTETHRDNFPLRLEYANREVKMEWTASALHVLDHLTWV